MHPSGSHNRSGRRRQIHCCCVRRLRPSERRLLRQRPCTADVAAEIASRPCQGGYWGWHIRWSFSWQISCRCLAHNQTDRRCGKQHRKMFLHECTSIPTPGRRLKTCPSRFNRPLFDFVKQPKKSEFFRLGVAEMAHTLTMAANFLPSCLRPLTIGK